MYRATCRPDWLHNTFKNSAALAVHCARSTIKLALRTAQKAGSQLCMAVCCARRSVASRRPPCAGDPACTEPRARAARTGSPGGFDAPVLAGVPAQDVHGPGRNHRGDALLAAAAHCPLVHRLLPRARCQGCSSCAGACVRGTRAGPVDDACASPAAARTEAGALCGGADARAAARAWVGPALDRRGQLSRWAGKRALRCAQQQTARAREPRGFRRCRVSAQPPPAAAAAALRSLACTRQRLLAARGSTLRRA